MSKSDEIPTAQRAVRRTLQPPFSCGVGIEPSKLGARVELTRARTEHEKQRKLSRELDAAVHLETPGSKGYFKRLDERVH